jgi:N-acetylglutamate synthase-like GNAT family acetyltransferase
MKSKEFKIRKIKDIDREWIRKFIIKEWGSEKVVGCGSVYYPHKLPGSVAVSDDKYLGLITYSLKKQECELVSFNVLRKKSGIGTALIEKTKKAMKKIGCKKIFLVTTNDNIDALRFYQKRGFVIKKFYPDAIMAARKIKPEISLVGNYGIPIRDAIKLELNL